MPLAILPRERTGLHIFEERYKAMVNHSLDRATPFGILLRDDAGPREVGCSVFVDQVLERHDDGRLDIVVLGYEPFRVIERFEAAEFPAARVDRIQETGGPAADEDAGARARERFRELAQRSTGVEPDAAELAAEDAYGIAGRVELPSLTKQQLLELRDEDERMRLVARALEAAGDALDAAELRAGRAAGNGHVNGGGPALGS